MFTFHAIDTATNTLSNKEHLNWDELDQFMLDTQDKFWACQVACDVTGKRVVYVIGESGEWEVHSKHKGWN